MLTIIVKENIGTIKNGKIENIFKDEIFLSLIEVYCILNNIDIKENLIDNKKIYFNELSKEFLSPEERYLLDIKLLIKKLKI